MESLHDSGGTYETALMGAAMGLRFVPCRPRSKVPLVKWKAFQQESPTPELYREWFQGTRNNIALVIAGLVIFDCDEPDKAEWVIAQCDETPWRVKTPRGIHLGYRRRKSAAVGNRVKIRGEPIDIRTDGGLAVLPPSVTEAGTYSWLGEGLIPISELPLAKAGWTRERTRRKAQSTFTGTTDFRRGEGLIRNPEAYCLRIESVQGQNGSRALVRVVCVLCDAGRTPQQIFDFIKTVWGPACCRPQWSDGEIRYCIERHYRKG